MNYFINDKLQKCCPHLLRNWSGVSSLINCRRLHKLALYIKAFYFVSVLVCAVTQAGNCRIELERVTGGRELPTIP